MRKFYRVLIATVLLLPLLIARAGAPLPLVTFYGMLVDEFGWPYESNVRVDITSSGMKILSRILTPAQGKDYNFLFRLPYDSGGGTPYTSDAISSGQTITLSVTAIDTGSVLRTTNMVVAFPPGVVLNVNLNAGTDSVGDGLPDELRYWIWRTLGLPGPFNPANIRAGDDSDGDGVSNLNEYLAGTDPANANDYLSLSIERTSDPKVGQLSFYTVPGKPYGIQGGAISGTLTNWSALSFASSPGGSPTNTYVIGTGHFLSAFVPLTNTNAFYRIFITPRSGTTVIP